MCHGLFVTRFEDLTAVDMKSSLFIDIMPCRPMKFNRYFGRIYRLTGKKPA
jgi:hypothetical protein